MPGGNRKGGGLTSSATYKLAAGDNPDVPVRAATKKTTGENPDTGTTGGRVGKGMFKTGSPAKSTGYAPFKMKGSPMQRNFGIGSPAKKEESKAHKHEDHHDEEQTGGETGGAETMAGMMKTGSPATKRDHTNPLLTPPVIKAGSPAKLVPGGKQEKIEKPRKVNKSGKPS